MPGQVKEQGRTVSTEGYWMPKNPRQSQTVPGEEPDAHVGVGAGEGRRAGLSPPRGTGCPKSTAEPDCPKGGTGCAHYGFARVEGPPAARKAPRSGQRAPQLHASVPRSGSKLDVQESMFLEPCT